MTTTEIRKELETRKDRSAWNKGVTVYALELIDSLEENDVTELTGAPADRQEMLNGAKDWAQYSWGGCALIYDEDIATRLCTASELKRTAHGARRPNAREEWLDVQARALYQAAYRILWLAKAGGK